MVSCSFFGSYKKFEGSYKPCVFFSSVGIDVVNLVHFSIRGLDDVIIFSCYVSTRIDLNPLEVIHNALAFLEFLSPFS